LVVEGARSRIDSDLRGAVEELRRAGGGVLPEATAKQILRSFGIAVPSGCVVDDVAVLRGRLSGPLVLKAVSPSLAHKSDAGGVRVGLAPEELPAAAAEMRASVASAGHTLTGFLVEELVPAGHELVVGAVRTPGVGWAVMVGLGGVFVEILEDVAFGIAPLSPSQISGMLTGLRGWPLLRGARGGVCVEPDSLIDLIGRLAGPGGLLDAMPAEATEIDLNPVIVSATGATAVDARLVVRAAADPVTARHPVDLSTVDPDFERLFQPRSVAVLGASAEHTNAANLFIRNLVANGYDGRVVPVHPSARTIEGLPAVASLADLDGRVDYAYVALPAARVGDALAKGAGRVRFAQVVSSGFAETEDGVELESALVDAMRSVGTRVIGPNCLGTHSSAGRLTFIPDAPMTPGGVAVVSQSGGLSVDILRLGQSRGIAFHSVTSIGNSSDVTTAELVEFLLDQPEITVVGLYLESVRAGRDVLEMLGRARTAKPLVLLAGGRTRDGSRAALSHTGALTGNHRLWPAIARQAGVELVDTLEELIDVLLAMDTVDLDIVPGGTDVVLFGNGGGASVLAADALERRGLRTPRLSETVVGKLDALGLPPGNGLLNPIDAPATTLAVGGGTVAEDILRTVLESSRPAIVITHLNVGIIQRNLAQTHGDVTGNIVAAIGRARDAAASPCHHFLVLKTDGKADTDLQIQEYRRRALALRIPVFPTFEDAAVAARALLGHQARTVDPGWKATRA
jgi:acyl-CoA synthetase (NDP forming)